jgi:hypothetical protein
VHQVLAEPAGVVRVLVELPVLLEGDQRQRPLAVRRARRDRGERGAAQGIAQGDAGSRDELGDRVPVHVHQLGDLVVRELLELPQGEHLALALGQRQVC